MKSLLRSIVLLTILLVSVNDSNAQKTTIQSYGTNSPYATAWGGAQASVFAVRNNNAIPMRITDIEAYHYPYNAVCNGSSQVYELWYTTDPTQVASTNPNPTTAPWIKYGVSPTITAPAGLMPIFPGISLEIPANTIMRLAFAFPYNTSGCGAHYFPCFSGSGSFIFSGNGVDVMSGINNISNGYYGSSTSAASSPHNFYGSITFEPVGFPCADTLDSVKVLAPDAVCPNREFQVKAGLIPSNLIVTGANFIWQYSNDGRTWSNYVGNVDHSAGGVIKDIITQDRWYRASVTCQATGLTVTTPPKKVSIQPFYYCYCINSVKTKDGADIGNLTIMKNSYLDTMYNKAMLQTGTGLPVYENSFSNRMYTSYHDSLSWPCLYRDSTFVYHVSQIFPGKNYSGGYLNGYVDYNRDGKYDPQTERIFSQQFSGGNPKPEILQLTAKVPADTNLSKLGPTGLRLVLSQTQVTGDPCDSIAGVGEVEDYIVNICAQPCAGPVDAGIVQSSGESLCKQYDYLLTDTLYADTVSGFVRAWQMSGDGANWTNIANSTDKDTLMRVFTQPLHYRLRAICNATNDTTYSTSLLVKQKEAYKCYCYSRASGGGMNDTSDIGGFAIAGYSNNSGGPHVLNPVATQPRTDYTDITPIELFVDSLYGFYVYHTMPVIEHGDAKVTIFMDYDNDNQYDIPSELIYSGYTSIGAHTLTGFAYVPKHVITDVPTGMRVILNNDVAPNVPSDEACGPYVSGETEDYMVIFRKKWRAGIEEAEGLTGFNVHPNPTSGRFHVQFSTRADVRDVKVSVRSVTGQLVKEQTFSHEGGMFYQEIDITGAASGMYFVELQADGQKLMQKLTLK